MAVFAAALAGCAGDGAPRDDDPEHANPVLFATKERGTPERSLDWDPGAVQAQPALRPLAEVLPKAKAGEANVTVTEQEAREIMDYLRSRWEEKYPGVPPSPPIIQYEGAYYAVVLAV